MDDDVSAEQTASGRPPYQPPGLLFRLVVPATAIFIVTVLSLIAVLFSDQKAPLAIWLDRNGNRLLVCEFITILLLSLVAMTVDRFQTLQKLRANQPVPSHEGANGQTPASHSSPNALPTQPTETQQ
ncbi:MAG: hypothetical protein KDA85_01420 [Planctomycetaceae bacterium]|nr:hypothetical protein [Planctomycetaceae bacterium]